MCPVTTPGDPVALDVDVEEASLELGTLAVFTCLSRQQTHNPLGTQT